jgi:hypothetical protein
MADDDVQLTDLEVIQQFSLAVRGATAPRAQVIAALESDLAYLRGARRAAEPANASPARVASARARTAAPSKAPVRAPAKAPAKAAKAPAKKAARRA